MREKRNFAQRTRVLQSDEAKRKYFLVYEGQRTEQIYFEAVDNHREKLNLNPIIELIPIKRDCSEEGWSNPTKIIDRIIKNLYESKTDTFSYETLLNSLVAYFKDNDILPQISKYVILDKLKTICMKMNVNMNDIVDDITMAGQKIIENLQNELRPINIIDDFPSIIEMSKITYSENFDRICFIIDRDKDSFTREQYGYVLEKCHKHNFGFYLTNPCFEFWLLLHFNDVISLDKNQLLDNPKIQSKKRYTEVELCKRLNFKKSKYDVKKLMDSIDEAIKNEKDFCEDEQMLESNIGSRIGLLIEEMRNHI